MLKVKKKPLAVHIHIVAGLENVEIDCILGLKKKSST
jgi:hypothetical protein